MTEEKLTERDYEVLDACCELLSMKIEELKAENDRLKRQLEYDSRYNDMQAEIDYGEKLTEKYKTCLQEIKSIAETELSYDMVGNEHRHYKNYEFIRHLITKAEEK